MLYAWINIVENTNLVTGLPMDFISSFKSRLSKIFIIESSGESNIYKFIFTLYSFFNLDIIFRALHKHNRQKSRDIKYLFHKSSHLPSKLFRIYSVRFRNYTV